MKVLKKIIAFIDFEAVLWLAGLIYLFFVNPYSSSHFTFCPYKNLGINFCPGCGLGKSIALFYHGDFIHSLQTHPLGIIAFIIILLRVIQLIRRKYFNHKNSEAIYG